jgi:S1-C subfamily serine protease
LLDSAGRLIGINTAIYSPSGASASAGIGFAVPVDTVNRVVPQLIRGGKYIRPSLGIEVDEELNERLKALLSVEGIAILRVLPGSEADRAGLKGAMMSRDGTFVPGDIIIAIDGKPVDTVGKLFARLDDHAVSDTVKVTIVRDGRTREFIVALQPGV